MWSILGIIGVAGFCAVIEYPSLKGFKKDRWTFNMMMLAAVSISIALALKIHIPNPLDWIAACFEPIGQWLTSLFQ